MHRLQLEDLVSSDGLHDVFLGPMHVCNLKLHLVLQGSACSIVCRMIVKLVYSTSFSGARLQISSWAMDILLPRWHAAELAISCINSECMQIKYLIWYICMIAYVYGAVMLYNLVIYRATLNMHIASCNMYKPYCELMGLLICLYSTIVPKHE